MQLNITAPDWKLEEVAMLCRRGEQTAWRHFHVKTDRYEEFFRCINEKMLAGEKTISQIEIDSLALGPREQPKTEQKRLAGPVEKPKSISVRGCLKIVDGIEKQSHGKDSITGDVCQLMRKASGQHRKDGAVSISWERWDVIARASMDLAEGRRKLAIAERKLAVNSDLKAAIVRKLKLKEN